MPRGTIDRLLTILKESRPSERDEIIADWTVRYAKCNPVYEKTDAEDQVRCFFLLKNTSRELWNNVYLVGDSFGWDIPKYEMTPVDGSRWWYLDTIRPKGARLHYMFAPNEPGIKITNQTRSNRTQSWIIDQRNDQAVNEGWIKHSVMSLPGFTGNNIHLAETKDKFHDIYLRHSLEGKRTAKIKHIHRQNEKPEKLLVMHDGVASTHLMKVDQILQAGVNEGRWPSTALLTLNSPPSERNKEYGGRYGYADYFIKTIIPAAENHLSQSFDPKDRIIAGSSLGAWAAMEVMIEYPGEIHNLISQSTPFWWPDEDHQKQIRFIAENDPLPHERIYLDVGIYETGRQPISTYRSNQFFVRHLYEKGYEFMAREFLMGHRYAAWSWSFPNAMDYIFLGKKKYGPLPGRKLSWKDE